MDADGWKMSERKEKETIGKKCPMTKICVCLINNDALCLNKNIKNIVINQPEAIDWA